MLRSIVLALTLLLGADKFASAAILTSGVSGTCGFYQGTRANVVYSETFSGNGTFCTGFMEGGSFLPNATLQVGQPPSGELRAFAQHSTIARAPVGYGIFAQFDTTLQLTQRYILTANVPPAAPVSRVRTFIEKSGSTDDGSGIGGCVTTSDINLAGFTRSNTGGNTFILPVGLGQPLNATLSAQITCDVYAPSPGFGDSGRQLTVVGPLQFYDANDRFLGLGTLVAVPEPATYILLSSGLSVVALLSRKRRQ